MLRIFFIAVVLIVGVLAVRFLAVAMHDFVLPFFGEDFDRDSWKEADHTTCARAPMVASLRSRYLREGTRRDEVEALLGRPFCDKNGVVDYSLGGCPARWTDTIPLLRLHYDSEDNLVGTEMSYPKAPPLYPTDDLPRWDEFMEMSPDEQASVGKRGSEGLLYGAQGERYGLNSAHELLVLSPRGEVFFLKDFREGNAGLHNLDVKACEVK